ncbi:MAG: hydrogenase expression/formation protein HypE [Deltaproteobacteria bacterium]|nr:hydrogenase expression/formation protein HypE [Deltaproteobacteria bacterium]
MAQGVVTRSHGGGGVQTRRLVEELFLAKLGNAASARLDDSAVLELPGCRVAMTTDSYVVDPWSFPGGNLGDLAICGTVNDLAMVGARPLYLTAGFILPEGFPLDDLALIVDAMARRAREADVAVVAGDTKVVQPGAGPFVNTAGIGMVAPGLDISGHNARVGDAVLVTGDVGRHGVAVVSRREGLAFSTDVVSDVAPLADLVARLVEGGVPLHALRDATRGGLAGALNEIAAQSGVEVEIDEARVPITPAVRSACDLLGLDALQVANEGCAVVFLPEDRAEEALASIRSQPCGRNAARIGTVVGTQPRVVARTALGGRRLVDAPSGELLPRIC